MSTEELKLKTDIQRSFFEAWFLRLMVREPDETRAFLLSVKEDLWRAWLIQRPFGG